jgi:hypothetical protein
MSQPRRMYTSWTGNRRTKTQNSALNIESKLKASCNIYLISRALGTGQLCQPRLVTLHKVAVHEALS